jgi:histidyl-tRNA synthetase
METLTRKSGEEVMNEIYTFRDKSNRELGLRFELTASIARMIANNPTLKRPMEEKGNNQN